jgi:rRNA maturation protein Nop10
MPRINVREADPERYARAMAEQNALRESCATQYTVARICPFCGHKVEFLYRGNHGPCRIKCHNCGEEVIFPALSFRRS